MVEKTQFTTATAEVIRFDYANHPSGLARLYVWRPDGASQSAPVLMIGHGGLWSNEGDRACEPSAGLDTHHLALLAHQAGWFVVSIDHPPSPSNLDPIRTVSPAALFPEPQLFAGAAVSFLRDNATQATKFGQRLWGAGSSINPQQIVYWGGSSGGSSGLLAGLVPDGMWPHSPGNLTMSFDEYSPRSSHRPNAVIAGAAQVAWTQYHMPTGPQDSENPTPYHSDIHQHFGDPAWPRRWSETSRRIKEAASPWFWLKRGFAQNRSMPIFAGWKDGSEVDPASDGALLTTEDFDPEGGQVLGDVAGKRAYTDPHHPFGAQAFVELCQEMADPRSDGWGMGLASRPAAGLPRAQAWWDWLTELGFSTGQAS